MAQRQLGTSTPPRRGTRTGAARVLVALAATRLTSTYQVYGNRRG